MSTEVLYFGNPMCSWCWGFAPVLNSFHREFADSVPFTLALGSLRQDTTPMRPEQKGYIRNHWDHVVERTGQSFDYTLFERDDFCYDDRLAAATVAAARAIEPATALGVFEAIQAAFYRDGVDITSNAAIDELLAGSGIDLARLTETRDGIDILDEYGETARLGVTGYPTLLALTDGKAEMLSLGYSDWATVRARLMTALEANPAS